MTFVEARFNRLSAICADIGQVCLASIVIPFVLEKYNPQMLTLGVILTGASWILSLILTKGQHE